MPSQRNPSSLNSGQTVAVPAGSGIARRRRHGLALDCLSPDVTLSSVNTVLTSDGQIEIPRELREELGLQAGNILELQSHAGTLVAWKRVEPDAFEKWRGRGTLPAGDDAGDYLRLIRDGDGR